MSHTTHGQAHRNGTGYLVFCERPCDRTASYLTCHYRSLYATRSRSRRPDSSPAVVRGGGMISSRYARDVRPDDVVTVPIGRLTHVGPVLNNHEADGAPIRRVLVIDCRTCHHRDSLIFAPAALVATERQP